MAHIYTGSAEMEVASNGDGCIGVRLVNRDNDKECEVALMPSEAGQFAQALLQCAAEEEEE